MRFILYSPLAIVNYKILIKLLLFPFLVYMANNAVQSLALNFYYIYSVDTLAHFLGGISIAYSTHVALSLFEKKGWITIKKNILRTGIILSTVMTVAVLWEFYEFVYDVLSLGANMQPSVADIIKDLDMGLIGAIVFCVVIMYKKNKKRS